MHSTETFHAATATLLLLIVSTLTGCGGIKTKTTLDKNGPASFQSHHNPVCLLAGSLPSEYKFIDIGRITSTKGTYGGSDEVVAAIAKEARRLGADAVVDLQASQRFKGPLPWRVTSPTGSGIAVKLDTTSPKLDCVAAGGKVG